MARSNWWDDEDDDGEDPLRRETLNQLGGLPGDEDWIDPVPRDDLPPMEGGGFDDGIDPIPRDDLPPMEWDPTRIPRGTPHPWPMPPGGVTNGTTTVGGSYGATPVGWDPNKWATEQTPKYIIGRILSQYSPTPEGVQQAMAEIQRLYPGATFDGFDTISGLGSWEGRDLGPIDVVGNAGASNSSWVWYPDNEAPGGSAYGGGVPAATALAGGGSVGGINPATYSGTTAGTTANNPGTGSALEESIRAQLMRLLGQSSENLTTDDPNLKPAATAYRRSSERSAQQQRERLAERMAAQGLGDSGALDAGIGGIYQEQGENVADFESQLVLNEMQARRQELQQALQLGAGLLTSEQQRQLQRELAALDAQIRREGIGAQTSISLQELALRQQLAQMQNSQFYDDLGFQIGDREAYWNARPYTL